MANLELVSLIVQDYDAAIDFFIRVLAFELVEDTPSRTNDGRPKLGSAGSVSSRKDQRGR